MEFSPKTEAQLKKPTETVLQGSTGPSVPREADIETATSRIFEALESGDRKNLVIAALDTCHRSPEHHSAALDRMHEGLKENSPPLTSEQAENLINLAVFTGSFYNGSDKNAKRIDGANAIAAQIQLGIAEGDEKRVVAALNCLAYRITGIPGADKLTQENTGAMPKEALPAVTSALIKIIESSDLSPELKSTARKVGRSINSSELSETIVSELQAGEFATAYDNLRMLRGLARMGDERGTSAKEALVAISDNLAEAIRSETTPGNLKGMAAKAIVDTGVEAVRHADVLIYSCKKGDIPSTAIERLINRDLPQEIKPEHFTTKAVEALGAFASYKFTVNQKSGVSDHEGYIANVRQNTLKLIQTAGQKSLAALPSLLEGVEAQRLSVAQLVGAVHHTVRTEAALAEKVPVKIMKEAYPAVMRMLTAELTGPKAENAAVNALTIDKVRGTFALIASKSIPLLKENFSKIIDAAKKNIVDSGIFAGLVYHSRGSLDSKVIAAALDTPADETLSRQNRRNYDDTLVAGLSNLSADGVQDLVKRVKSHIEPRESRLIFRALAGYRDLPEEIGTPEQAVRAAAVKAVLEAQPDLINCLPQDRSELTYAHVALVEALGEYTGGGLSEEELRQQLERTEAAVKAVSEQVEALSRPTAYDFEDDPALPRSVASRKEEFVLTYGSPDELDEEQLKDQNVRQRLHEIAAAERELLEYRLLGGSLLALKDRLNHTCFPEEMLGN